MSGQQPAGNGRRSENGHTKGHPTGARSGGVQGVAHIAIAVHNIGAARPLFEDVLGLPLVRQEDVTSEGVRVAFFDAGNCLIELLEPLDEDSSVARFLARRGEGIHHVAFRTGDLPATMAHIVERVPGALIDSSPRPAAGGAQAAFLHPKHTFGALVELYDDE